MSTTRAKAAEQRGDTEEAIRLFAEAGEFEEAARVLIGRNEYGRAGKLLMRAVGLPIQQMHRADAEQRKLAIKAGICLVRAGEISTAVSLFVAAGDGQRAIDTLTRSGDTVGAARLRAQLSPQGGETRVGLGPTQGHVVKYAEARRLEEQGQHAAALSQYLAANSLHDAARVSRVLGKTREAAELFAQGSHHYEAAVCFHETRDPQRCLSELLRVPKDHARYRASCVKAIELSQQFGELGFELDQLVSRFVSTGPQDDNEADAFYVLGRLYERANFLDNARECYGKVVQFKPSHRARERLAQPLMASGGLRADYDRILREDAAFMGDERLRKPGDEPVSTTFAVPAELPELPELPDARKPRLAPAPRPMHVAPAAAAPAKPAELPTAAAVVPMSPLELKPGIVIAERYRLDKQLGQGGTAIVFKAADLELEEDVAIKIFTMNVDDPDLLRRFKQELSVTRKLSHPNIVRLHDIGMYRGFRFLTMEVLQGQDLCSVLARGRLPLATCLDYLIQAARGLSVAHQNGVVHRDIKPENFFVTTQNVLKVMDFGIAKKQAAEKRTQAGFIAGTPPYMSPEQINGFADVTTRADIYSLGIVAYEMLTGVLPFQHEELMPLLVMHLSQPPEPLRARNPQIPAALEALVLQLLEKQPSARVQTMAHLADQLEQMKAQLKR